MQFASNADVPTDSKYKSNEGERYVIRLSEEAVDQQNVRRIDHYGVTVEKEYQRQC